MHIIGEDCFEQGTEFIPERWTTRREMVRNVAAYSPWGTGQRFPTAYVSYNISNMLTPF
jgi:hypothetical protein